ncbi:MAG: prepilin-type N-terminal cleavage/methylation domain-containing protein [Candidatus Buchananbacteria bacterium]
MKCAKGFTLIEFMIVAAIIAIIAAIAIPNLMRSRMSANEAAAAEKMREIMWGEIAYQKAALTDIDKDGLGDYASLIELANPGPDKEVKPFINPVLARGMYCGYIFTVIVKHGDTKFLPAYTCTAVPAAAGRTGFRQYFVDASGVIRFTADGSAVNSTSTPLN